MTERHPDEVILGRWTVDPAALREFTTRVRTHFGDSPFPPHDLLKACDKAARSGLEVVCRDDAVLVGPWCLAFLYNGVSEVRLEEHWLHFEMEGGQYFLPVPVGPGNRAEAARMVEVYARQQAEETRRYREERDAPTLNNRLLTFVETHWVWAALGFFFVVIPLVVLAVSLLTGNLP
ncbi:MAG: hypothetical protein IPJ95_01060 [Gemmatimonadetes bacterium]|nr:hypothetical protein [Gemmatimonadota bacterium]MBK7922216.1 hypothetical protein [Gemmatimonadota bacterium]MBK9067080.1 hypothetical protein [Gemmatimonadota bacterium]